MRWTVHVTRIEERIIAYRFWWVNLMERDHMYYLHVDGRIILKWIFEISDGGCAWTGSGSG